MSWLVVGPIRFVTVHTNALTMENSFQWPRLVIPPIGGSVLQPQMGYISP